MSCVMEQQPQNPRSLINTVDPSSMQCVRITYERSKWHSLQRVFP